MKLSYILHNIHNTSFTTLKYDEECEIEQRFIIRDLCL